MPRSNSKGWPTTPWWTNSPPFAPASPGSNAGGESSTPNSSRNGAARVSKRIFAAPGSNAGGESSTPNSSPSGAARVSKRTFAAPSLATPSGAARVSQRTFAAPGSNAGRESSTPSGAARLSQRILAALTLAATLSAAAAVHFSDAFSGTLDQVGYPTLPVTDPVEQLNRKISTGSATLERELGTGYLRAVLDALHVPVESQMLVFSRTSLQQRIIYPGNPRAIYFNDSVAVGWTKGEPFVEVAAQDPRQGIHFYTVDQYGAHPKFERQDGKLCLNCHESYAALDIPGMLIRSSPIGADGFPNRDQGNYVPDDRSAFEERFGGWYVTGDAGAMHHLGNVFGGAALKPFDGQGYLSNSSDIVPLLVFTHQMRMMNLITRLAWEFRVQKPAELTDAVNEFVDYLLFRNEPALPSPVHGASGFAEKFAAQGPRDPHGRSLRDFDLRTRLMRYPCSYMIYSQAFDGMPEAAKDAVYRRIFAQLQSDPRPEAKAALEILRATKPGFGS